MIRALLAVFCVISLSSAAESLCTSGSVDVSYNTDDTFDVVFNGFNSVSGDSTLISNYCTISVDVGVPEGKVAVLTSVAISGSTAVDTGGFTAVNIIYGSVSGSEMFQESQAYVLRLYDGGSASTCGEDTTFSIDVGVFAYDAFINASSGSGEIIFVDC